MTEYTALAEKLMRNFLNAFKNDPLIDDYDFIPVESPEANTNPILCTQHKLGIQSWAVKVLYSYCYDQLFNWLALNGQNRIKSDGGEKLQKWSQFVVMVMADCMTAWNVRKQLIKEGHTSLVAELKFTQLVLRKHPKSSEVFFHRKWLLSKLFSPKKKQTGSNEYSAEIRLGSRESNTRVENGCEGANRSTSSHYDNSEQRLPHSEVERLLIQELQVCQDAAERYANNYHAWTHRVWIFQSHCSIQLATQDLESTKKFVYEHISDYSAYHYRQMLLQYLNDNTTNAEQFLEQELDLCTEFICRYPGHEAVWSHRRAVIHQLYKATSRCKDQTASKKLRSETSCVERLLQKEQDFCDDLTKQYKSQSVIHDDQSWQMILSNRYMAALTRIIQNSTHS